jgi:putative ABC transport system substrate-binding protein
MTYVHARKVADFAATSRVPAMYAYREITEAGGLMSYGPNIPEMFRRATVFVDKILKGAKPAELSVEQPTIFELVLNLKTAKALGVTFPHAILLRADQVIE